MMTVDYLGDRKQVKSPLDVDSAGIMAALKRAATKAQRHAIETSGSYAVYQDGKIVHVTEVTGLNENKSKTD